MAKQRIIAITGASGGLAQEIVKQLSPSDGIILLGRDKDKLEKCYRHVENKTCLAIDLRDDNAIKKWSIISINDLDVLMSLSIMLVSVNSSLMIITLAKRYVICLISIPLRQ